MQSFRRETIVEATPSQVFKAITELDHARKIMPDIVKVKPLTNEPLGPGYKWKETRQFKMLGFIPVRASAVIEVLEFERNKRYQTVADDGCNWAAYTFKTTSAGPGKTKLVLVAEFKGVGKYEGNEKVAQKLAAWCEKSDGDLVQRVKAYVEST